MKKGKEEKKCTKTDVCWHNIFRWKQSTPAFWNTELKIYTKKKIACENQLSVCLSLCVFVWFRALWIRFFNLPKPKINNTTSSISITTDNNKSKQGNRYGKTLITISIWYEWSLDCPSRYYSIFTFDWKTL